MLEMYSRWLVKIAFIMVFTYRKIQKSGIKPSFTATTY